MDNPKLRPRLIAFRVLAFSAKNSLPNIQGVEIGFEMTPLIELGLVVPAEQDHALEALVNIQIQGRAAPKETPDQMVVEFSAAYEARFVYPKEAKEADISPRFEIESHQYMLVAQAFPLSASHFRRELMAMGFNVGAMPLGI